MCSHMYLCTMCKYLTGSDPPGDRAAGQQGEKKELHVSAEGKGQHGIGV